MPAMPAKVSIARRRLVVLRHRCLVVSREWGIDRFNRPKAISGLATSHEYTHRVPTVWGFNRPKAISGLATKLICQRHRRLQSFQSPEGD